MTVFIVIAIIAFIIYKLLSNGGAKSVVSLVFKKYLDQKKTIKFHENGKCELKGDLIFENQKQAKLFILNMIFDERMSTKDKESFRYGIEIEAHETINSFSFDLRGEEKFIRIINFSSIGDVITTIWYIESGIRASHFYGEFAALDSPIYDDFASKVITKEYNRLCEIHHVNETEDLV